jgi:cell division septation protein DedD
MSLDAQSGSPPARERASSPRYASASANDGPDEARATSGNYLVQLSSQKSESEARASFRALQAKFPGQLGSRSPVVRRADLGDKGVYYRALVGPFGSSDEAGRFCTGLRAAGGQCIIQRN